MSHLKNYEVLIDDVRDIYKKHQDLKRESGVGFNIFQTLGISRDENSFSALIAGLLSPKGSHLQGDIYLRLFLEILFQKKRFDDDFDIEEFIKKAHIETEQFNTVDNTGGRIDIVIETRDYAIVIENKIDAPDQANQLWRYHQSKINKPGTIVVYLTLDGRLPDENSTTIKSPNDKPSLKQTQIVCLSYREDILNWLEECLFDTPEHVAAIIRHFLQTIKQITNREENPMEKELTDLLKQDANKMKYANELAKAADLARAQIEYDFFMKLKEHLDDRLYAYGFVHEKYTHEDETIAWCWIPVYNEEKLIEDIIKSNKQSTGVVRLAYKNKENGDVLFIADGQNEKSFWYGFKSENEIPKEIKNFLPRKERGVRYEYYKHPELPLWGDGIYALISNMDEVIEYTVSDIMNNIMSHLPRVERVRQVESTATLVSKPVQFFCKRKLKNYMEE